MLADHNPYHEAFVDICKDFALLNDLNLICARHKVQMVDVAKYIACDNIRNAKWKECFESFEATRKR